MTNFLPPNYTVPTSGNYMKLEDGANKIMILGSAILGYEYWNFDNKPVRLKERPAAVPEDIRKEDDGKPSAVKHFWAFPVWNYSSRKVEVLEITQKGIMGSLQNLAHSEDWGDPIQTYAITINRSGKGFDTEYNVVPSPKTEFPSDIGTAWDKVKKDGFDIGRLFEGGDPFSGAAAEVVVDEDSQTPPDDYPEYTGAPTV